MKKIPSLRTQQLQARQFKVRNTALNRMAEDGGDDRILRYLNVDATIDNYMFNGISRPEMKELNNAVLTLSSIRRITRFPKYNTPR